MVTVASTSHSPLLRFVLQTILLVVLPSLCSCQLVYRTRIGDKFGDQLVWRDIEYDEETGRIIFIGEQFHGLDLEDGFWWCGMNYDVKGSGLLEHVMKHSSKSRAEQLKAARKNGHKIPSWMDGDEYPTAVLKPASNVLAYANKQAPGSSKPPELYSTTRPNTSDYVEIDASKLLWLLLYDPDAKNVYLGVGGSGVSKELGGKEPPGDGTSDKDNGVRVHISFRGQLPLSEQGKKDLKSRFSKDEAVYDDTSAAYPLDPTEISPDL